MASLLPRVAFAQSVVVQVTSTETGAPLAGVFVSLLDSDGRALLSRLTDASGRALIPLEANTKPFRVRAELVGRETQTSEIITTDKAFAEAIRLSLPSHAIPLSQLEVGVESRCRLRPEEASIVRVWQEARKALQLQAWANDEQRYEFEFSTYERRFDSAQQIVEYENRKDTRVVGKVPFASLPPQELVAGGFVRPVADGGYQYYGPDAAVLLSDVFLDTHCLGITRSPDRPGWIGLTFRPVDQSEANGIRGTFWLDEERGAFGLIEYGYSWSPHLEAEGVGGGEVQFTVLPDGAWIIERWSIRTPVLARLQGLSRGADDGVRLVAIRETGGEVSRVTMLDDGRRVEMTAGGALRGVVWDSTAMTPLGAARVRLAGTTYEVLTDSAGRFVIEGLPSATFTVVVEHGRLDSLDLEIPRVHAKILPEQTTELALATPSWSTLSLAACRTSRGAVVWGVVRSATGDLLPGAGVHLEWGENGRIQVEANEQARYTACGVPVDGTLRVRASFLGQTGEARELAMDAEAHRADLEIGFPPGVFTFQQDTVFDETMNPRAGQGIRGRLVERGGGRYVSVAEVTLRSPSGRVLARSTTDEDGLFLLQVALDGRLLLSVSALGYKEIRDQVVEVDRGKLIVLTVQMAPEAVALEPLVATTEARSFRLEAEGFYRRRDDGLGVHIPPEVIERRRANKTTDLFFGIPRTRVIEPAGGGRGRALIFSNDLECWPMIYIDRLLVSTGGTVSAGAEPTAIDDLVSAADIDAIEVFRSPAEIPSEFNGPNAGCGVVVLWTRRGGDR